MVIFEHFQGHFRLNWGRITLDKKIEQLLRDSNPSGLTLAISKIMSMPGIWTNASDLSKFHA